MTAETRPGEKKIQFGNFSPLEKKVLGEEKPKKQKVILLSGPTACGKTTLSLMLAEALGGEIVSADSMQVYKGMDIGTAKVSQEDRMRLPHYLIDIRHIQEPFNVVDFYYEAKQAIDSILARNRIPIVVGGTGFYFHSLIYGPPSGPPPSASLRQGLENEIQQKGSIFLYQKLKEIDPAYASSITCNDKHKIIRALEIITLSGEKVSNLKKNRALGEYLFHAWFCYRPQAALYPRIEMRCESMIELGLIDEVKTLIQQGLKSNSSASQAIGYKQVIDFLASAQTSQDYQKFLHEFKKQSRRYAKRQFTWFRKEPLFRWINVEVHDFEIAMDMIIQDFSTS